MKPLGVTFLVALLLAGCSSNEPLTKADGTLYLEYKSGNREVTWEVKEDSAGDLVEHGEFTMTLPAGVMASPTSGKFISGIIVKGRFEDGKLAEAAFYGMEELDGAPFKRLRIRRDGKPSSASFVSFRNGAEVNTGTTRLFSTSHELETIRKAMVLAWVSKGYQGKPWLGDGFIVAAKTPKPKS